MKAPSPMLVPSPLEARAPASLLPKLARRVLLAGTAAMLPGAIIGASEYWQSGMAAALTRAFLLGACAALAFSMAEAWPRRLPAWFPRWVWQILASGLSAPCTTLVIYLAGSPPFWLEGPRTIGFLAFSIFGAAIAAWAALAMVVWQKDALARQQALALELKSSEYKRHSLQSRLRLLQAQVAPHFLFNTLSNVRALVETGSPKASLVLDSLVSYLRRSLPRLDEADSSIEQEVELSRAYLELMVMRMPDRLRYDLSVAPEAGSLRCPPLTLLTLVENAIRHGIDPSVVGGNISVSVRREGNRCLISVADTGVGLNSDTSGLGTGLSTLRERLAISFAGDARLRVIERPEGGVTADVDMPAIEEVR